MSDDKNKRNGSDRQRINMNEDYEVKYWSEKLGVSTMELKKAVEAAGPMVTDVERRLKGKE